MAIDADIAAMSKTQVQKQLRNIKESGKKINVSGNVPELRQRLQDARDQGHAPAMGAASPGFAGPINPALTAPSPTPSVAGSTVSYATGGASTTGPPTPGVAGPHAGDVPGGKLSTVMLKYKNLHPAIFDCLQKFEMTIPKERVQHEDYEDVFDDQMSEVEDETNVPNVMKDQNEIETMAVFLQPVCELVDSIIDLKEHISTSANSSPAINFETLGKMLRSRTHHVTAPSSAVTLFMTFGITVDVGKPAATNVTGEEGEQQDTSASQGSAPMSIEEVMQRRYEDEIREAQRESQRSSQGDGGEEMGLTGATEGEDTEGEPAGLEDQIAIVQQGVLFYLRDWIDTFPAPENRQWPVDYDRDDVNKVKGHIRAWARDTNNSVNLDLHKQPDNKADELVKAMMADNKFPFDDAKQPNIIKSVFRDVCSQIYAQRVKNAQKAAEAQAAEDAATEGDEDGATKGDEEGASGGRAAHDAPGAAVQREKRGRSETPLEEGGVPNRDQSPTKKSKANDGLYGSLGPECCECYFEGQICELRVRNDPRRLCAVCRGSSSEKFCRLLCEGCATIANEAGRGSQAASFLVSDCPECEYRYL